MPNKYLKEYIESKYDKETNYSEILSRVKGESIMNVFRFRFTRVLATVAIFLVVFVGIPNVYAYIKWNAEFTEFMEMPRETIAGTKIDEELVDMGYIEKGGIKARVESLVASDDEIRIKLAFEFDEGIEVNSRTFTYSYAVYDENHNMYTLYNSSMNTKRDNVPELIYRELGVKYDKNDVYGVLYANSNSMKNISAENRKIVNQIRLSSLKGFPKARKIYVRIFDLGYNFLNLGEKKFNEFNISKDNWIFEIDIPDKFYYSTSYDLKLKNEIEGFTPTKMKLSDTGFIILAEDKYIAEKLQNGHKMEADEFTKMQKELMYVTDGNGNRVLLINITLTENEVNAKFFATKQILDESKLFLNVTKDGKVYTSELIKETI